MPSPLPPPAHPIRDRLWLAGGGVLLFLVTMAVGTHVANPRQSLTSGMTGDDFLPSYMAGAFVREGRPDKLMDFAEARRFQAHERRMSGLEQHGRTGPWLNPPYYALPFAILAGLPYPTALRIWVGINCALLAGSLVLLCRMLPEPVASDDAPARTGWRQWGLVPLLLVGSMPFVQVMACQQNTFVSLVVLAGTVTLWRAGRALAAGLVAGLLLYKPQMAVVVSGALALTLGWRAVLGVVVTAAGLLLASAVATPGALTDYLHKLSGVLPWMEAGRVYHWERQVTFHGFWRLLMQGPVSGPAPRLVGVLWPICSGTVTAAAGWLLLRAARGRSGAINRDRVIAATVAATPLVMPYFMDYDLALLAIPAVLFAADVSRRSGPLAGLDRWTLGAWVALAPWLFLNAAVGFDTHVSLTVPMLVMLWGLLTARAWRVDVTVAMVADPRKGGPEGRPIALRHAA